MTEGKKAKYYTGYAVISVDSFKSASTYRKYVQWDAVQSEDAYNRHTQDGDRFYFCLKGGFEFIHEDDSAYALSMIAVRIDITGELTGVYTRDMDSLKGEGDLKLKSPEALEKILNMSFNKTFKPYPMGDVLDRGGLQKMLDSGVSALELYDVVRDRWDGYKIISVPGKKGENVLDRNNKLLSPKQWFTHIIEPEDEGPNAYSPFIDHNFFICEYERGDTYKYYFLTTTGKVIPINLPGDHPKCKIYRFYDGYAVVKSFYGETIIGKDGKLICKRWFRRCTNEKDSAGTFYVEKDGLCNRIKKGKGVISPKRWFDSFDGYNDGYARVRLGEKYNFIDLDANLLSDTYFEYADDFKYGYATVKLDGKHNILSRDGKLMFPKMWFDYISPYYKIAKLEDRHYATVTQGEKHNIITLDGRILSPDMWFDDCECYSEMGNFIVKVDDMYNILSRDGKLISPKMWFDDINHDFDGEKITAYRFNEKCCIEYYFIYEDGTVVNTNE